jgi:hypothetical protein
MIEGISAVTLATHNMPCAVRFYRIMGFEVIHGGDDATFTSFRAGTNYLNLIAQSAERGFPNLRQRTMEGFVRAVGAFAASIILASIVMILTRHVVLTVQSKKDGDVSQ